MGVGCVCHGLLGHPCPTPLVATILLTHNLTQVNSFPTLMLFDGATTHKLTSDRSIPGLEKWFSEVLPAAVVAPVPDAALGEL